jgi:hypothetical protein
MLNAKERLKGLREEIVQEGIIRVTVRLPMQVILSFYFASGAGAKLTKRLQL